jgi:hypothetical protein
MGWKIQGLILGMGKHFFNPSKTPKTTPRYYEASTSMGNEGLSRGRGVKVART